MDVSTSAAYPPVPHPPIPRPRWWRRPFVRYAALITLLAVSGVVILALVREQTGTRGLLVGLGLAVFPVPLLVTAFRWLDRVDPAPWRNTVFAFAWGACAATLIAIVANTFTTQWIANTTADPDGADTLGATLIAPIVEESAKAAAVLLVFLFSRRQFTGLVDGVVIAGTAAAGFAFTENILYLGSAYGTDRIAGDNVSVTAATFFVRVIMSPFAHPLFTVFTGIGFGLSALTVGARRVRRVLFPLTGLVLAMGMHSLWNGSAHFGPLGFFVVYGVFMVPVFGLLTWLVIWTRQRELRYLREELPPYVAAGWLSPAEPFALASMKARRVARDYATHYLGKPAAKTLAEYESTALALAQLRRRGRLGHAPTDFVAREHHLLTALWTTRTTTRPALEYAARATAPAMPVVMPWQQHGWQPPVTWQQPPVYGVPAYPPYGGYRA
ncbi:PrsW family intramembrane metalloprotease [Streptomyces acidiscabies]|uniref:PrsW family intramembrane metalloprotease n=1 Tax=Streptomyces acidiscabies TaxID=42234 RepID=UPI0038F79A0D